MATAAAASIRAITSPSSLTTTTTSAIARPRPSPLPLASCRPPFACRPCPGFWPAARPLRDVSHRVTGQAQRIKSAITRSQRPGRRWLLPASLCSAFADYLLPLRAPFGALSRLAPFSALSRLIRVLSPASSCVITRHKETVKVKINRTGAQLAQERRIVSSQLSSLTSAQRAALLGDNAVMTDGAEGSYAEGWQDIDSDDEDALRQLPPGEEGDLHSHAGEADFQAIFDGVRPGRGDLRIRDDRLQKGVDSWNRQMPALVDAYLNLKAYGPADSTDIEGAWSLHVLGFEEHGPHSFSYNPGEVGANEALLRHGFIGSAPDRPVFAFPIRLFEIYRQLHRVCPRFSLDALSKTLTHLHHGPRKSSLRDQMSIAYDAYLGVLRGVEASSRVALGRTGPWYMDNVCAPCLYKTVDEPYLKFSWLGAMDGNNSLKWVDAILRAGNSRADDRVSVHDRWITPEQVDIFKDEVSESQKRPRGTGPQLADMHLSSSATLLPTPGSASPAASQPEQSTPAPSAPEIPGDDLDDDVAWLNVNELDALEAEELAKCINTCVDRWRAAGPDQRKKMFALFAISGIFLTVCRHGHVVVMCDMIRSGELMKYPLAMIKRLLDRYGKDIGLGYDIMCAFFKTLLRSSLGSRVVAMRLRGVVPAFHGHAHNRACQVGWHPLYVEGVGLEDFEECERTFSQSNQLAGITRLCQRFHRQQALDEHFDFHDLDKHASSGNFIYQNYRQAIEKISLNRTYLDVLEQRLHTTDQDYEDALIAEQKYFKDLRSEPADVAHTVDYIELLLKLHTQSDDAEAAKTDFQQLDHHIINNGYTGAQIARVKTRYRTTWNRYMATHEEVCRYEELHGITERWTPARKEYKDALVLATERHYKLCVSELERLVVGRLFETTKLGMSGVAYKMREKLSKALKTRAEAIRKALNRYNDAAAALTPPRPRLTWHSIINTASLAEFDWLRETREDIRSLPWAQPAVREAMVLYFGMKRATEEKVRLNVEIRRLVTFMLDDHVDYYRAIAKTLIPHPALAHELQRQWTFRTRINTSIAARLELTARLKGFTGSLFPGEREGRDVGLRDGIAPPLWLEEVLHLRTLTVEYEEPDDADHLNTAERRTYDVEGMAREGDFDESLVIDLLENLSTADNN
ncbi:hypothetical protein DFH07DRAFT_957156 [Mycena maculata]|uniref:CxC1-like cysteine cluster associated with KDZ transposases domain-containing protein n=1 Tax=Mycena maculata TaxID=230809 RepID=A0AAD7JDR4_9AGAR|nr:hypothetical protein DFH07DRAFT_957156 [Mycena maculata]